MLDFLTYIRDLLDSVVSFAISLVTGILNLFKALPQTISLFSNSILYLPSTLSVFATLTITISVVYLVLNRDPGG